MDWSSENQKENKNNHYGDPYIPPKEPVSIDNIENEEERNKMKETLRNDQSKHKEWLKTRGTDWDMLIGETVPEEEEEKTVLLKTSSMGVKPSGSLEKEPKPFFLPVPDKDEDRGTVHIG